MPRSAVTEAFTWIGTALALGVAIGASAAGRIVDAAGANTSFLVSTGAAAVATVAVALGQRQLHVPAERCSHAGPGRLTEPDDTNSYQVDELDVLFEP